MTACRRFRVALSFSGEDHRGYVRSVAELLAESLGRDAIFFDEFYEEELAVPNLDLKLQKIFKDDSDLLVPFFCENYVGKKWCKVEWDAIRAAVFSRRKDDSVLAIRFDNTEIEGFLETYGYISLKNRPPVDIASLILKRLNGSLSYVCSQGNAHPEEFVEVVPTTQTTLPVAKIIQLGRKLRVSEEHIRMIISQPKSIEKVLPFRISKFCVTNEEYWAFVREKATVDWPSHWNNEFRDQYGFPFKRDIAMFPVTDITVEDAKMYCLWKNGRLPTSSEWEYAALADNQCFYPWGNKFNQYCCNGIEKKLNSLCSVEDFSDGDTPSGLRQMAGNVWEMTIGKRVMVELRGGSYRSLCEFWGGCLTFRVEYKIKKQADIGFRLVKRDFK